MERKEEKGQQVTTEEDITKHPIVQSINLQKDHI
jgi:hypothetical protein